MLRRSVVALSLAALAACNAAPTGPSAAVSLSLSQTSLTIGRNTTGTVTAALGASDVTAAAAWSSSDSAVVSVENGVLRAVGLGSATVTASYRGRTAMAHVTVRRNTSIGGVLAVRDISGHESFGCLSVRLDGLDIGGRCGSDHRGSVRQEARFGVESLIRDRSFVVSPGVVPLAIHVWLDWNFGPSRPLATEDLSYVEFFDADTGESLERVSLPRHEAEFTREGTFTLPVTVKTYTQ